MAHNKVMIGNTVIMDISNTTADPSDVLPTKYYYDKNGDRQQGTCTYNADTSSDLIEPQYVKAGITFHDSNGGLATEQQTGTVTWNDTQTTVTLAGSLPTALTPAYYNGVTFSIDGTLIKADNIRKNITILGVTGTYEGTEVVEPTKYARAATDYVEGGVRYDVIEPSTGYTALDNVKVGKIWYYESDSGKTANIYSLAET